MLERLIRTVLVLAVVAVWATAAAADDRDLLRAAGAAGNVLVIVDTSTSMASAPDGGSEAGAPGARADRVAVSLPGAGDDPRSRLAVVKAALRKALADSDVVNLALAATHQQRLSGTEPVVAKHWLYQALDRDRFGMVTPGYVFRCGPNRDGLARELINPAELSSHTLRGFRIAFDPEATPVADRYGPLTAGSMPVDTLPVYFDQCVLVGGRKHCEPGVFPVHVAADAGGGEVLETFSYDLAVCPPERLALLGSDAAACDGYCVPDSDPQRCQTTWEEPRRPAGVTQWQRRVQLRFRERSTLAAVNPAGRRTGNTRVRDLGPEDYDLDGTVDEDLDGDDRFDWILPVELIEQRRKRECDDSTPRVCGAWTGARGSGDGFDESWGPRTQTRQELRFKLLYEAVLSDRRIAGDAGQIDHRLANDDQCGSLRLVSDLPPPPGNVDTDKILAHLEPVATAVRYLAVGPQPTFEPTSNDDPASPSFDPIPLIPWGRRPLAAALQGAFAWYAAARRGDWVDDPLADCRSWAVVLIAGGADDCGADPCAAGQAARRFAEPGDGLDPVPVHTISLGAGEDPLPALACISEITGGRHLAAAGAADLDDAVRELLARTSEAVHAFLPVTVFPPPVRGDASPAGTVAILVPAFIPRNQSSIWEGHLWAFELSGGDDELPLDSDGRLDPSLAEWDAARGIGQAETRQVFFGHRQADGWQRLRFDVGAGGDLADRPGGNPVRQAFVADSGLPENDLDDVVSWLRAAPLGDIFHSRPVVVAGPANPFYLYGGMDGEDGLHGYGEFARRYSNRRRVVLAGSNDGLIHAFDAGTSDGNDLGQGNELFAYLPRALLPRLRTLAGSNQHQYMVDGGIEVADVFIPVRGGRGEWVSPQWRTVALFTMRRGGRGVVALDITEPDPAGRIPTSAGPACLLGDEACSHGIEYPRVLWELTATEAELGYTWSKPIVARLAQQDPTDPDRQLDLFVAFFGGGRGGEEGVPAAAHGGHFYAVDVATGRIIYKHPTGAPVPAGVAALDADLDGLVDRLYFGDEGGRLWRLDVSEPARFGDPASPSSLVSNWRMTRIYDFSNAGRPQPTPQNPRTHGQRFFATPKIVPARAEDGTVAWALAIGSGNRADLLERDGVRNRFYFLLDVGDETTRGEDHLVLIDHDAPAGGGDMERCAMVTPGKYGWALRLRPHEKVNDDATAAGVITFPTFEPHRHGEPETSCGSSGIARVYTVFACNAEPYGERREEERDHLSSASETWSSGTTISIMEHDMVGRVVKRDLPFGGGHRVSNWRQD